MRPSLLLVLSCAVGCGGFTPPRDVIGPYGGTVTRFRVDQLVMPTIDQPFSDDLNGDDRLDNQLARIVDIVALEALGQTHTADLISGGMLASIVELQSDDAALRDDPTVGVRFLGADGDHADVVGGKLTDGTLTTNRVRWTATPGKTSVRLPLLTDADPVPLDLVAYELELVSDGQGGWNGQLHGAAAAAGLTPIFYPAFNQSVSHDPVEDHVVYSVFDTNGDGVIDADEFAKSGLVVQALSPDVQLFADGRWAPAKANAVKDSLSIDFAFHLAPCGAGGCAAPPAAASCFDRIRNGDETDVDCGGSCGACPVASTCNVDGDCQTRCTGGVCAQPSCSDGVTDGWETDVDCGSTCVGGALCAVGQGCYSDADCASGHCTGDFNTGTCIAATGAH
jgi:hypothetical protein